MTEVREQGETEQAKQIEFEAGVKDVRPATWVALPLSNFGRLSKYLSFDEG